MEMIEVEAFIAVAQTGSITRASEALHRSQPAISRRIELLEREVGAVLFERVQSGVRLTDAGEAFLPYARQILAAVNDGMAVVQTLQSGDSGTVTLALVGTLAGTGLTTRIREFRDAYPRVNVRLRTALSSEVSTLVEQGAVMLGLRYFPDPSKSLESSPVGEEQLVVVCSAQSSLLDRIAPTPEHLKGVPWVGFPTNARSSGEPFTRILERQLLRAGLDEAEIVAIDSLTAQKRLIEADFGVGLLPFNSVDEEVRLGTLKILPIAELTTSVPIVAVHRRRGYLSPAANRLFSTLVAARTNFDESAPDAQRPSSP